MKKIIALLLLLSTVTASATPLDSLNEKSDILFEQLVMTLDTFRADRDIKTLKVINGISEELAILEKEKALAFRNLYKGNSDLINTRIVELQHQRVPVAERNQQLTDAFFANPTISGSTPYINSNDELFIIDGEIIRLKALL